MDKSMYHLSRNFWLVGRWITNRDLSYADLPGLDFRGVNFARVNFARANLIGTDFRGAFLQEASFYRANLTGAHFQEADLRRANLNWAGLLRTEFHGANLAGTCFDPTNVIKPLPDDDFAGFQLDGDKVYGWRTKYSQHCGSTEYKPGECYEAPVFSTDIDVDCHPGIYFANLEWLRDMYPDSELVRCYALRNEIVKSGGKYRAKRLWIVEGQCVSSF